MVHKQILITIAREALQIKGGKNSIRARVERREGPPNLGSPAGERRRLNERWYQYLKC